MNEGFTELLASRIFNNNKPNSYLNEVRIMELVEFFFNNTKELENLYFSCNLAGLIKKLESYSSRKEVIDLILLVDRINRVEYPLKTIYSIKAQLILYKIFLKTCPNNIKLNAFEKVLFENKIIELMLKTGVYNSYELKLNNNKKI